MTPIVSSKSAAYKNGNDKMQTLANKSGGDLGDELNVWNSIQPSIHLDNAYVSVNEFMNNEGAIVYQGIVNTKFHYQEIDRNN